MLSNWKLDPALPADAFEKVIEQVRGIDMEKVKSEVAAAQAKDAAKT